MHVACVSYNAPLFTVCDPVLVDWCILLCSQVGIQVRPGSEACAVRCTTAVWVRAVGLSMLSNCGGQNAPPSVHAEHLFMPTHATPSAPVHTLRILPCDIWYSPPARAGRCWHQWLCAHRLHAVLKCSCNGQTRRCSTSTSQTPLWHLDCVFPGLISVSYYRPLWVYCLYCFVRISCCLFSLLATQFSLLHLGRVTNRDKASAEASQKRIQSQMPIADKVRKSMAGVIYLESCIYVVWIACCLQVWMAVGFRFDGQAVWLTMTAHSSSCMSKSMRWYESDR